MTPERWKQIDELVHAALARAPGERAAFLAQACTGDDALRREIESLISYQSQASSFLEQPAMELATEVIASEQEELVEGSTIGHYKIVALLGSGGMGDVYLARDSKLGRQVALKLLPKEFTQDGDRLRRFDQEACAASALNHPNILTIYEIGETDGTHFIATEFIDGETLRERITAAGMKIGELLNVAEQIASALTSAHDARIIHRDIKPDNIMVRRDALIKVLDFGLAKLTMPQAAMVDTEAATRPRMETEPGVVMGTAQYMSPEQARGQKVDARTDIFSLGVVLYEMVTGRVPFAGATGSDVIAAILKREPLPLMRYAPDVPTDVEWIVRKALRKDQEERYQTAKELLTDLKSLKQRLEFEAELERSATPEKDSEARRLATSGGHSGGGTTEVAAAHAGAGDIHTTSSAEHIVGEIKRHKLAALLILATLGAAIITVAYFVVPRYFVRSDKAGIPAPGGAGTIRSIAVLPFTNTSGNPDTEYLSDGISESLINSLSQLPGVKVIARSSTFKYKGREVDPQEVANALGVEGILTGRVAQRGENLLISVELVNARDKTQVWGEQYNRRASDVLAVLSEISREMAEKLRLRLTAGEQQQLAKRETANPQAYELVLKGRFYRYKGGTEDKKKAVEYYQQAIVVDPTYALAYAGLSGTYVDLIGISSLDPKEFTPKAEAAARRALELDESLAEAHAALAYLKGQTWDWVTAEREYNRAIELNPNSAIVHSGYAYHLSVMGRHEQAVAETKLARALDPLSPASYRRIGQVLYFARQYDEAIEAFKKALELEQNHPNTHLWFGYVYAEKGMYKEAIAEYQEVIKLGISADNPSVQIFLAAAYAKAGARERAEAILKRLETSKEYVSPGELAILYAALGARERAFTSLERAYAAHDLQLRYLGVDPSFDPLRSDPRFTDLMRRVGLAPAP